MSSRKFGILHPGQMGVAVGITARKSGCEVFWASEGRSPETRRRADDAGFTDLGSLSAMCEICDVIAGVCPPEFAEAMAHRIASEIFHGIYVDANAISPQRARRIGQILAVRRIAFVDGCIIGLPVTTRGETWIYLSGEDAPRAAACFGGGPLEVEILQGGIGQASALKMCYSAHAKGMAALRAAVLATAAELGVLEDLQRQWSRSGPTFERAVESIQHTAPKAWRFVAEMHEIAETFESAGMPGDFHRAAAEIYSRLAPFKGSEKPEWREAIRKLRARAAVKL